MSNNKTQTSTRPPIVVIMGHIDHGKSTLLDYIRKTNIVSGEAGGITQHISAYEAECDVKDDKGNKRKIIFLDTPGHEAFHSVREHGSKVADIAVLVVSAEDGVKPQTIEAIECINKDKTPYIVAINKIDKPNANIDKTKQGLAEANVFLEGWGGSVPVVPISAKTGEGINDLLETILLQGDMEELAGNNDIPAMGFVLESNRDSKKGISATLIIKDGSLKKGMYVVADSAIAPVRIMEDFKGRSIEVALPSTPVNVIGWNEVPKAGQKFMAYTDRSEAENSAAQFIKNKESDNSIQSKHTEKQLPIIIKSDALGSLDALEHELNKLNNDKISLKIISSGIGPINESDVKLAASSSEVLLAGFRVKADSRAMDLALRNNISIKTFDVIYELVDWVTKELTDRTPREQVVEISGTAKIVRVFSVNKTKQIVGGVVESGIINVNDNVKIMRRDTEIGEGKIKELQSQKIKTSSAEEGKEFGMMFDAKIEVVPGDRLSTYKIVTR